MVIEDRNMPLNYVKKEDLTGSYQGMRYIFQKEGDDQMRVTIWPEPYSFVKTPEEEKKAKIFPLTEEGKQDAIRWMNQEYNQDRKRWTNAPNY